MNSESMIIAEDYNELDRLEKIEGREAIVLYSRLIYRMIEGEWAAVGKLVYRR